MWKMEAEKPLVVVVPSIRRPVTLTLYLYAKTSHNQAREYERMQLSA